ncbi:alpha/beta hydrolase [Anthocerotibacter panamensis]|uniref:alpha/beta hydrolase n=1 Tax=Anthocerotibacter panamensis TaxID=2857077 RepID=UPI001C4046ED|nr:alpha/beta fold hydrolase [Anthocerotibacter panamensis]
MFNNQPFILEGTAGRACLLLHGLGGGVYELELLGQHLHAQGWTVVAICYPGHRASGAMPASTWSEWYGHIEQTYLQLAQTYATIAVVGFSTGCPLGLYLAACHPVERLVLLSPFIALRHFWYYLLPPEVWLRLLRGVLEVPTWGLPIRDAAMRQECTRSALFTTFNLTAVRSALELIEIVKPQLPDILTPTLILMSPKDSVVAPSGAEYLYQRLGAPQKKLHWLCDSDHIITLDLEREEVFAQTSRFLAGSRA